MKIRCRQISSIAGHVKLFSKEVTCDWMKTGMKSVGPEMSKPQNQTRGSMSSKKGHDQVIWADGMQTLMQ